VRDARDEQPGAVIAKTRRARPALHGSLRRMLSNLWNSSI